MFWFHDARRVELHQFWISWSGPRFDCQPERVSGVLISPGRGTAPNAVVSTSCEDHGVGMDEISSAVVQVEPIGAEHSVVTAQNVGDVHGVENRDSKCFASTHQATLDF